MSSRFRRVQDRILTASLSGLKPAVSDIVYRLARPAALREVAAEIGAKTATLEAIAEAKAYDQIGGTEIGSFLSSQFVGQPQQNLQTLASLYETHPWVKICCSYIAEALAGIPLRVWTADGYSDGEAQYKPADDTPVGQMFAFINPRQSPRQFVTDLASWLLLTGEAYVAYSRPGPGTPRGVPAEMYVLFSPFVEKVVSPTLGIVGYQYRVGGEVAYFDTEDVTYFNTFSPAGRFRGQGAAAAGIVTVQTDQELRQFNRNVLRQGVHLSGVLETDNEDMNRESAEVVRKSFEAQYAGSSKAAKVAVLWGGLRFSPQTILQKDIMMAEQVAGNRDEIIALYGLKPELLTEKFANKATAETVRRMAYEDTILGRWGALITSVFNATGLSKFDPSLSVRFDPSDVPALHTSLKERIAVGEIAIRSGQMTINEVRGRLLNMREVTDNAADVLQIQTANLPVAPGLPPVKYGVELSTKAAADVAFHRTRATAERKTEAVIRSVLRSMQNEIRATVSRSTVDSQLLAEIEQIVLIDGRRAMVGKMSDSLKASVDAHLAAETATISQAAGVGVFDVKPERAMRRLVQQEQRVRDMMGNSWADLRKSLVEGLQTGETTAEINRRTADFFGGMRKNAATVARTEVNSALNGASADVALSAKEQGIDIVSVWITSQDGKVRARPKSEKDHAQAHGLTIVPGEELFVVSGERLEFPGDSWNGATAANTINCRCALRNEVRSIKPTDARGEVIR